MIDDLSPLLAEWAVPRVAAVVISGDSVVARGGDVEWQTRVASISKLLTAYAGLVALDRGVIDLDQPAGRPGATIRHLLSHAAGYGFEGEDPVAPVGARRVYSNTGIDIFAHTLAASTDVPIERFLHEVVFAPLGMAHSELRGSAAHAVYSTASDLVAFAREVLDPRLIDSATFEAAITPQFPGLPGVVPGVGRFDPNPWGLGFEIKGGKHPHWTGSANSGRTIGHFGGAGTFLWIDPEHHLSTIVLTNREFGRWALETWPGFSDEMIRRYGAGRSGH